MSGALFTHQYSLDGREREPIDGEWVDVVGHGRCVYDRSLDCWRHPGEVESRTLGFGGRGYRVLDRDPARFLPVAMRTRHGTLRRVAGWNYGGRLGPRRAPKDTAGLPILNLTAVTWEHAPERRIVTVLLPANGRPTRYAVVSLDHESEDDTVARALTLRAPYARGGGSVEVHTLPFEIPRSFPGHLGRWGLSTFALAAVERHTKSQTAKRSQGLQRRVSPRLRFQILKRDGYGCQICGATAADDVRLHVDHKVALAKGGTNDPSNLWTLCAPCNLGKGILDL